MSKPASMTPSIEALCDRIKAVRSASALSQVAFAARLGVSKSYLSEVEVGRGKPSIEMLTGIAREFPQTNLRWLLCGGDVAPAAANAQSCRSTAPMTFDATAPAVIARLKLALGARTDQELGTHFGNRSRFTVAAWRSRNSIPFDHCIAVAISHGVSLDWLLLGRGPISAVVHAQEAAQ